MSPVTAAGGINSVHHSLGKIGDSDSIFDNYDVDAFMNQISKLKESDAWIATHCHPSILPLDQFKEIINITTTTYRSKIYRWARCFYHYYSGSEFWQLQEQDLVDKRRETAKNYLKASNPVYNSNVINLEFSEVVESTMNFLTVVNANSIELHINRWKKINYFLYDANFWTSVPVQNFHQAELEVNLQTHYRYV
jgi:hypothetical protein